MAHIFFVCLVKMKKKVFSFSNRLCIVHAVVTKLIGLKYQPLKINLFNKTNITGLLCKFGTDFIPKTEVLNQEGLLPFNSHRVLRPWYFSYTVPIIKRKEHF